MSLVDSDSAVLENRLELVRDWFKPVVTRLSLTLKSALPSKFS